MKAESQACCLGRMMSQYRGLPQYELSFPPVLVKRKAVKKLTVGDFLLLGFQQIELVLCKEGKVVADIAPEKNGNVIKIIQTKEEAACFAENKKYEAVQVSLGTLQSRTLEPGHRIEIAACNLQKVSLFRKGKRFAEGSLANVDDRIAVQIDEIV